MKPIDKFINSHVSCTKCGTKGIGNCDCWTKCACGWLYERGTKCRNPIHNIAMTDYTKSERIAIKMDSHISESDAIMQTDAEIKAKQKPESVLKAEALQQKIKADHASKMARKSTRFNYRD